MLSHYASPFVGRTLELAEITARLAQPACRLLSVTGAGGSGKTRLALEAAALVRDHFPDGIVAVPLQPVARSDLLVPTIAQAVGATFHGQSESYDHLLSFLRAKQLLLVLDNFEHLLDGATLASELLAAAPRLTILVTSREALNLQEEWLYPLGGLATPPSVYATALEDYAAVQLFAAHASRIQPQFDLAQERDAVLRICMLTGGLPLAIELAASWLKGLSAAQIAGEMQRNLDFLVTTARNAPERHRSMRAVFDQSWNLLTDAERRVFARLSVFAGGFDAEAAAQVAEADYAILAALVEKSLIMREVPNRFGLHELLRQYGREKLEQNGDTAASFRRHSHHFAQVVVRHERAMQGPAQSAAFLALERDWDNLRQAWEWASTTGETAALHAMLNGLYLFGFLRSRYPETIALFRQTLERPLADVALRGRLLARRWGYLHWLHQTDDAEARSSVQQALSIAEATGDRFELAFTHLIAAYTMISAQRYAEAEPHLMTSHALFVDLDEPFYTCWALHRIGYMYYNLNQIARGNAYTEQCLILARTAHNPVAQVICLYNLGSSYLMAGDYRTSQRYCAEALDVSAEYGHRDQIAHALSIGALAAFCLRDYDGCRQHAERSWGIIAEIGSELFQPYNRALLVLLACLAEQYDEGVRVNATGSHHSTNRMGQQLHYWAMAVLACGRGATDDARRASRELLRRGAPEEPAATLWLTPCAASLMVDTAPEVAIALLVWALDPTNLAVAWARDWPLCHRLQARLERELDPATYQRAHERGAALTPAAVIQLVEQAVDHRAATPAAPAPVALLSAREHEILRLLARGMTNPAIAAELVIGAGTVKTHTLNIYRKLDVANRTAALHRARELGLLPD